MSCSALVATLDGSLSSAEEPLIRPDDPGFLRADGVFDVTRGLQGEIFNIEQHLERFARSAAKLNLAAPDADGYRRALAALTEAWDWHSSPEVTVRLVLTRGGAAFAMMQPVDPQVLHEREQGIKVLTFDRGSELTESVQLPWYEDGAKSLAYGISSAARRYAEAHGADDGIFYTPFGRVLEGLTSAVVVDIAGELVTVDHPAILASTTVVRLRAGLEERDKQLTKEPITLAQLKAANGAWLISSGRLAARITELDGEPYPQSPLDALIREVLEVPPAR